MDVQKNIQKSSVKKMGNKGFTLVELLATIAVLSIIIAIVIFTATNIVGNAREKSYKVAINNIEQEAGSYVIENNSTILWLDNVGFDTEYQCVTVQQLIDKGYFSGDVLDSEVKKGRKVNKNDYIYLERDKNSKAVSKQILLYNESDTYYQLCLGISGNGNIGTINVSYYPTGWSREKEITIKYQLFNNVENYDYYNYYYEFKDDVKTNKFNNHIVVETVSVTQKGELIAVIKDKNGKEITPKEILQISKIDRIEPVINHNYTGSSVVTDKVVIPIKVIDEESGIDETSFTKDDIVVKIGNTIIENEKIIFTKMDNNNYTIEIEDNTHEGVVTIIIDKNNVLDNASNGNVETILTPEITFTNKYTVSYNANGGIGTMDNTICTYGNDCSISANTYTKTGYTFDGWTTKSDGSDDGYEWTNWSGKWNFQNDEKGIKDGKLELYARWIDVTPPTAPVITRIDYNTFSYLSTDDSGISGYYVSNSSTKPTISSSWTVSSTKDISSTGTYYVWAKDETGNISDSATIKAYKVVRSQGDGTKLITKYDSVNNSSGTEFNSSLVVLQGTNIWLSSTVNKGYTNLTLKNGNTSISNPTSIVVNDNINISSGADRFAAPTVPKVDAFYADNSNNKYTSGVWTNKQVYTTLSTNYSGDLGVYIQYKDITGSTWVTFSFGVSSLSKNGTTYSGTEPWNLRTRNNSYVFRACEVGLDLKEGTSDDLCSSQTSSTYNIRYDLDKPILLEKNGTISSTKNSSPGYNAYYASNSSSYSSGDVATSTIHTKISAKDDHSGNIVKIQYTANPNASTEGNDHTIQWKTLSLYASGGLQNSNGIYYGVEEWTFYAGRNDTFYFRACDSLGNCSDRSEAYNIKYVGESNFNISCSDRTYTGSPQVLVSSTSTSGYTLSNYSQTNVGTYTITAKLKTGYIWDDGSTDDKTLSCKIDKATPTITLSKTSGTLTVKSNSTFNAIVKSGGGIVSGTLSATSSVIDNATVSPESTVISNADNTNGVSTTETITGIKEGSSIITVSFVPSDTKNYNSVDSKTYKLTVKERTYTVTADAQGSTLKPTTGWTMGSGSTTASKTGTYNYAYGVLPEVNNRRGYTFEGWSLLPSEYQQVEYIQSNGSEYIDTGYYWQHENIEIYFDGTVITNSSNQSLFGNEEYINSTNRYFAGIPHGKNGSYGIYIGTGSIGSVSAPLGTRFNMNIVTTANKNLKVYKDGGLVLNTTYSGSVMTRANAYSTSSAATTVGHIFLFANHNTTMGTTNASIQNVSAMRVYGFKLYDNDVLVRDIIPCYRKSDKVVGMYDIVGKKFYTTPTGTFTKGSNVKYLSSTSKISIDSNHKIYAQWEPMTYTIKYDCDGGTGTILDGTCVYGQTCTTGTAKCAKNGYVFTGWGSPGVNGTGIDTSWTNWTGSWGYVNGQYGITNNVLTLKAQYVVPYTINFNQCDKLAKSPMNLNTITVSGSRESISNIISGTSVSIPSVAISRETFTKTGYLFNLWTTKTDSVDDKNNWTGWNGTWVYSNGEWGIENYELNLCTGWTPKTYTVTFNQNGGTGGTDSVTATYDSSIPSITVPTNSESYKFGGYYTNKNARDLSNTITKTGSTIRVESAGTSNGWTMTTDDAGKHVQAVITLTDSTLSSALRVEFNDIVLTKGTHYNVVGGSGTWTYYLDFDLTNDMVSARTWGYDKNYRFFDFEGATSKTTATVNLFVGFGKKYYDESGKNIWDYDIDGNITLYAKWNVNKYTVTLDKQGGTGGTSSVTATYNNAMPSITPPTNGNYQFGGYYTGKNGSGVQYYTETGESARKYDISNTTTLYAKWNTQSTSITVSCSTKILTYTGVEQIITSATSGTGYTLSNYTQTNAGTYTITANLKTGYIWDDGTTNSKTIKCSIGKVTPTITLSATSGTVEAGSIATFTATTTSSVNAIGTLIASSNDTSKIIISNGASNSITATTSGVSKVITYAGTTSEGSTTITVKFNPNDTNNFNSVTKTFVATNDDTIAPTAPSIYAFYDVGGGSYNYSAGAWTDKQVNTTLSSTDNGTGVAYMEYQEVGTSIWNRFSFSKGALTQSGNTWSGTEPWNLRNRNQYYYFRACDYANNCSLNSEIYNIRYDTTVPKITKLSAIYDLWGSEYYTIHTEGYEANAGVEGTWQTSTNDPYIMFDYLDDYEEIDAAFVELESPLSQDIIIETFYAPNEASSSYYPGYSNSETLKAGETKLLIPITKSGTFNITKVRFDIGSVAGLSYKIKALGIRAKKEQWNNDNMYYQIEAEESFSGISKWEYKYDDSSWTWSSNSSATDYITTEFEEGKNKKVYFRACNAVGKCSSATNTYIMIEKTKPFVSNAVLASNLFSNSKDTPVSGTHEVTVSGNNFTTSGGDPYFWFTGLNSSNVKKAIITFGSPTPCEMGLDVRGATSGTSWNVKETVNVAASSTIASIDFTEEGSYSSFRFDLGGIPSCTYNIASIDVVGNGISNNHYVHADLSDSDSLVSSYAVTSSNSTPHSFIDITDSRNYHLREKVTYESEYVYNIYAKDAAGNVSDYVTLSGETLYAVNYNANGGVDAPEKQTKTHNKTLTLSSKTPTRSYYTFDSWNTKVDGTGTRYIPGESYTGNNSITLYAQWTPEHLTINDNKFACEAPDSLARYKLTTCDGPFCDYQTKHGLGTAFNWTSASSGDISGTTPSWILDRTTVLLYDSVSNESSISGVGGSVCKKEQRQVNDGEGLNCRSEPNSSSNNIKEAFVNHTVFDAWQTTMKFNSSYRWWYIPAKDCYVAGQWIVPTPTSPGDGNPDPGTSGDGKCPCYSTQNVISGMCKCYSAADWLGPFQTSCVAEGLSDYDTCSSWCASIGSAGMVEQSTCAKTEQLVITSYSTSCCP